MGAVASGAFVDPKKTIKVMWKMSRINGKKLSIWVSFVFLTMLFHLHRVH